jgi:uncharacterized protein involved in tolerance to divalent cations
MRAKEYLEINKERILYFDIVKSAIDALGRLRNNKIETEEYFNRYLFADARYAAQKEEFEVREGEVNKNYAYDVRMYIMNAVSSDESFIFTYNIILMQKNKYFYIASLNFCKLKEINCNTVSEIERVRSLYKEDYPNNNLMCFLHDDDNSLYYEEKQLVLNKDVDWWLSAFNEAYAIFDNMRLLLYEPFDAKRLITEYKNKDKELENTIIEIVKYLVAQYDYDLSVKQKKEIKLLSKLIDAHFSHIKKLSYVDKITELENVLKEKEEEYQRIIKTKDEVIEANYQKIECLSKDIESKNKGLTIPQQNLFYYYMFNELGVNFSNSKKKDWAKIISALNGKNEEYVRKALSINFDDDPTINDMRIVATTIDDLFPRIKEKILNDIEA